MHRLFRVLALTALMLAGASAARAAPLLYAYEGAGCTGLGLVPQLESFLGRKLDGVIDFVDFSSPTASLGSFNWDVGCWKGHGYRLSIRIPLAFGSGAKISDVAAGGPGAAHAPGAPPPRALARRRGGGP